MEHKEMNLLDLCAAMFGGIGKGVVWVISQLGKMLRLTFRQWWVVLITLVLCVTAALYYARPSNRIYKVNAIAKLNGVTNEMVRAEYQKLAMANPQFESQSLSNLLGVDADMACTNFRFEAFDVIDLLDDRTIDAIDYKGKFTKMDTLVVHVPNMLALRFRTKSPNRVPEMQEAILNYLNSLPHFQALYACYQSNIEREARFHHDQLEKLDSLTSLFCYSYSGADQLQFDGKQKGLVLGRREIKLFLEEIYAEMDEKEYADANLAMCIAPVVLQSDFTIEPCAINGSLRMAMVGILGGWLLGVLIAALIEYRKYIATWLKS